MAVSHVQEAVRPIGRDLSKRTTDFIQQGNPTFLRAKQSVRENFRTKSTKNLMLSAMTQFRLYEI